MKLSELHTGDRGIIVKVKGHGGFRKRIIEMGFIKGKEVEVILNAPLKDPVKYRIMGYEVSLRREEAQLIDVISGNEALERKDELQCYYGTTDETTQLTNKELANRLAQKEAKTINIALIGNPNCGKTSLFNFASGAHERVGNYSGVTVDAKEGKVQFEGYHLNVVDLPGTYSLSAYSAEELYVRNYLVNETPDVVINVVDASNLERNLYLTTQLIDMNMKTVMALNMHDELEKSGNELDIDQLSKLLGMPIMPTNSKQGIGIAALLRKIIETYEYNAEHAKQRHIHINYGQHLEQSIDQVKTVICENEKIRHKYSTRYLALKLLEMDPDVESFVCTLPNYQDILKVREANTEKIKLMMRDDSETALTNARYGFINGALKETFVDHKRDNRQVTKQLDNIFTHKIWGFPFFFLFLFLMFKSTFVLGQYPMDWINAGVTALSDWLTNVMEPGVLKDLLVDGIVGGVGGVIVFLPNILILFCCISLMEDSGYMARAAFIMDKVMHKIGLHGKSFIPLVMGFGCNVPAIIASRTIEDKKSRLITVLINPLMSCSARLPLYIMLTAAFFPEHGGMVLMSIYLIGILLAALMAKLFHRFLIKGADLPFVMELPPYRWPTSLTIWRHTWEKGKQYLRKMGGIILVASILVWFLSYYPRAEQIEQGDGVTIEQIKHSSEQVKSSTMTTVQQDSTQWKDLFALYQMRKQQEYSYIGRLGKFIEPALKPLGFDWKLGIGLITGAGAKELVVSTISVLYPESKTVEKKSLADRLGISSWTAYGLMLFTLLYFPCIATLSAIKQETGSWRWVFFSVFYTTALAWIVAYIVQVIRMLIN